MRKLLVLLATAAAIAATEGAAGAATLYVNQSDPVAYDAIVFPSFVDNPCLDPAVPCRTVIHAEDRADDAPGNTVVVLPDPGGQTDVYDGPVEVGDGATRVDLVGAGQGDGGTLIRADTGQVVRLLGDSRASDLAVTLTGASGIALAGVGAASRAERITADAPAGQGLAIFGSGRDLVATAKYGGAVSGTLSRARVIATDVGLDVGADLPAAARLLDTTILASGPASTGLRVQATGTGQAGDVRHVTVTGFDRDAVAEGTALPAKLRAVNSVFAGADADAGLVLVGPKASAELERTDVRTQAFLGGADQSQAALADAIDAEPGLDGSGHLTAGSPLIDHGTSGGVLAGAAEDDGDVDGQPRVQGGAVDIGADEAVPATSAAGGGGGGIQTGGGSAAPAPAPAVVADPAPMLGGLRVTPRRLREGRRAKVGFTLSEPARVDIALAKRVLVRHRGHRLRRRWRLVPVSGTQAVDAPAGAGAVVLRRGLRRGSYAVTAIATDIVGNRSAPLTAGLRVLARRRPAARRG